MTVAQALADPWWGREDGDWFVWACRVWAAVERERRAAVVEGAD